MNLSLKNLMPLSLLSKDALKQRERQALDELYDTMRTKGKNSMDYWEKKWDLNKVQEAINK